MSQRRLAPLALAALLSGSQLRAQEQPAAVRWQPVNAAGSNAASPPPGWTALPSPAGARNTTPAPNWQPLANGNGASEPAAVVWQPLPAGAPSPEPTTAAAPTPANASAPQRTPTSSAEAQALLNTLPPSPADDLPLLRLGPAVPTANQLGEQQGQFSVYQLAPLAGSGIASGPYSGSTGNQNYVGRLDLGLNDRLQLSAFYSVADDPLWAGINGKSAFPYNYWESYGGALQWQLLAGKAWTLGLAGSLEGWTVGSGGCNNFNCKDNTTFSPNQFNDSGAQVLTRNLVGSLNLPLSWQATRTLQLTFTPGVSFLPSSQGAGQGGAGPYYGTNITLAAGGAWRLIPQLTLFGSGLLPLGPGSNSFNSDLVFQRVPILTGGVNWALNPRIGLEASLTNGWGGTPATALLALPSANQLGYLVRFLYNPAARDTPQPELSPRRRSIALGGLTVNTALVPPDGTNEFWANADSGGNLFGFYGYSLSNIFQLELAKGGWFHNVPQTTLLADAYTSSGAPQFRIGGKAVSLSPLRGFPIWVAGRISAGREYPPGSGAGYVFAESILTWEASRSLALHLNPKLGWSGNGTPWGLGFGANLQLGPSFQLIPEANLVASDLSQSNGTLALRWLASDLLKLDLYVGNAAGLLDMGQLLGLDQLRVGGRMIVSF